MRTLSKLYPDLGTHLETFLSEIKPFQGYLAEIPSNDGPRMLRLHFSDYEHFQEISKLQRDCELCDCADQADYIPFASLYFPQSTLGHTLGTAQLSSGDWEILDRAEIFLARSKIPGNDQIYLWNSRFVTIAQDWEHFLLNLRNPRYVQTL